MNSEDWKHIEDLYCAALEREVADRAALLAAALPEVRRVVERMLACSSEENILDRKLWIDSDPVQPRALLDVGTQLGPYTILSLIGEGGMSSVYQAADPRLNRDVAIKILAGSAAANRERLGRFELEARAAGSLNHPNVLTVHDIGSYEGSLYLVTELLDGETLRARIHRGKLPRQEALNFARMIAAGLAAAHAKGITHRDLKPENLFVTRDGRLKILDFGLAEFSVPAGGSGVTVPSKEDAPKLLAGTIGYMSPEQVQGLPVDTRSDLFNVGIVVFEMVTGVRPFLGATPMETLQQTLEKEPRLNDVPEIDGALARFLGRCFEKDPRDRFASAGELLMELEALDPPPQGLLSRRLVGWYLGGGVAAAAGLAWLGSRKAEPRYTSRALTPGMRGNIATARFTPDGRTIVFSAGRNGRPVETFRISAEGGEIVPFGISSSGIASISATDELALFLDCELNWGECRGTLARRPLNGGDPAEVDEISGKVEFADWSPNGDLAIIRVRGSVRVEFPIREVLFSNRTGWISHLRFSPKGDRLAFFNHPDPDDNHGSVEVVDLMGERTTLVSGRQGLKGLAWTPAGDEIWFSGTERERTPQLRAVNLKGQERIVLDQTGWYDLLDIAGDGRVLMMEQKPKTWIVYDPNQTSNLSYGDWAQIADLSDDGRRLLIYEWGQVQGGKQLAYLRDAEGGSTLLGEGKPLALCPDERWVLAVRSGEKPELVLLPVKEGTGKRLPNPGVVAFREAAWVGSDRIIFAGVAEDGSSRSYIQSIDGGGARPIGGADIRVAVVSPDGKELAAYGGNGMYHRLSINGEERGSFTGLERNDELLRWGDDGGLYVRANDEEQIALFRVDAATGSRTHLKSLPIPDPVGFLGFGPTRITRDGKLVVYTHWNAIGELYLFEGLVSRRQLKG